MVLIKVQNKGLIFQKQNLNQEHNIFMIKSKNNLQTLILSTQGDNKKEIFIPNQLIQKPMICFNPSSTTTTRDQCNTDLYMVMERMIWSRAEVLIPIIQGFKTK